MTDFAKALGTFFKLPVYVIGAVLITALIAHFVILAAPVPDWPASGLSQPVVRAGVSVVAILCGALLLTRLVAHIWPAIEERIRIGQLRAKVRRLSDAAKAALRIAAEGGKIRFYGEPSQPYVQDLLTVGLITTDSGGDRNGGWGLYAFTEDGREIVSYGFKSYHDLIDLPAGKLSAIRLSMKHAGDKAPR